MQTTANCEADDASGGGRTQVRLRTNGHLPDPCDLVAGAFSLGDGGSDDSTFLTQHQARVVAWAPAPQVPAA